VDDNELTTINTIIMKTIPKKSKENCITPPIIAFALASQLNTKQIPSKNDIIDIQDDSRDGSKANDYDDNKMKNFLKMILMKT
ncbi:27496_t:CDS:2, partial [Racocetra persica]